MAGTFSQIYIQVVFAVKGRENLIVKSWRDELHKYIAGIIKGKEQKSIIVNGVAASNFVILPPAISAYLSFVQQHWLQYAALLPYRLYCGATGCQDEKYDQLTGLSPAVVAWLPVLHVTEFVLTWPIHLLMAFLGYYCFTKKQNDQKML